MFAVCWLKIVGKVDPACPLTWGSLRQLGLRNLQVAGDLGGELPTPARCVRGTPLRLKAATRVSGFRVSAQPRGQRDDILRLAVEPLAGVGLARFGDRKLTGQRLA